MEITDDQLVWGGSNRNIYTDKTKYNKYFLDCLNLI